MNASERVHHARCACGQLSLEARGEPTRVSVCHCLACQRRTGSAFGAQVRFARENVRVLGRSNEYVRIADSGNRAIQHFCPDCGATLHYALAHVPEVIAVPLGTFDDPGAFEPRFSVYEQRKHAWVEVSGPVEHTD
jgi:hypothetical protein